jgi:hypothetical protein
MPKNKSACSSGLPNNKINNRVNDYG